MMEIMYGNTTPYLNPNISCDTYEVEKLYKVYDAGKDGGAVFQDNFELCPKQRGENLVF